MEKNGLSLDTSRRGGLTLQSVFERVTQRLSETRAAERLAGLYAFLLEERVTPRRAVYFFYAQLSALGVLSPVSVGAGWRLLFLLCFLLAAGKARA